MPATIEAGSIGAIRFLQFLDGGMGNGLLILIFF